LAELCTDLAKTERVTVIAGQPNFVRMKGNSSFTQWESHDGVDVCRVRSLRFSKKSFVSRALGLGSYLVLALLAGVCARRPDVIVVETDPPLLGALGAVLKWWHRCRLVFYLQDLFPEVALALRRLKPGPVTWLLSWTTQLGLRHADRVIVLAGDMRHRVLERGISASKIAIVPNWADTSALRPANRASRLGQTSGANGRFVVMYSGNLGLSQNLDQVLAAAEVLREQPVIFLLVGDGAAKAGLQARAAQASLDNVRFLPYQPKERLCESLNAADVHLIPLRQGLAGCIVPCKLYPILACGIAYIAAVDGHSEIARLTLAGKSGLVIEPDSPEQLVQAISWCLSHQHELLQMGQRGRELAETHFDRTLSVAKFQRVLEGTVACARSKTQSATGSSFAKYRRGRGQPLHNGAEGTTRSHPAERPA
jgi:glycosyltransferase involved in cell wall biosynthesis